MYRIYICENDAIILSQITEQVKKYFLNAGQGCKVIEYSSGISLMSDIENGKLADIYILTIEIPIYSGIDIARTIADYDSDPIIFFITSHIRYAVDVYNYNVFKFIPKTELEVRMPLALKSARIKLDQQSDDYYYIKNKRRFQKIPFKNIIYIYKSDKNSILVLGNSEVKIRKALRDIYKEIDSEDFVFADKCYIVNLKMINEIDLKHSKILFKSGKNILIAKTRINEIMEQLNHYWGKRI